MGNLRTVGRLASIACSVLVGLAFVLPVTMTGRGGGMADGAIAAGYFLLPMAAASIIAVSTAVWGRVAASSSGERFQSILLAPLAIVVGGVAILFISAAMRGAL